MGPGEEAGDIARPPPRPDRQAAFATFGLASIDFKLPTSDLDPAGPLFSTAAPSSLAWLSTMFDKVANGTAGLPLAISAIGLPLSGLRRGLGLVREHDVDVALDRLLEILRLEISSAPPEGTRFDTTMTLVCGAFDFSQAKDADGIARRRQRQFAHHHRDMGVVTMCGYWISMCRGRSMTVDSNAFFISS